MACSSERQTHAAVILLGCLWYEKPRAEAAGSQSANSDWNQHFLFYCAMLKPITESQR